jgi:hypothetical protein
MDTRIDPENSLTRGHSGGCATSIIRVSLLRR